MEMDRTYHTNIHIIIFPSKCWHTLVKQQLGTEHTAYQVTGVVNQFNNRVFGLIISTSMRNGIPATAVAVTASVNPNNYDSGAVERY